MERNSTEGRRMENKMKSKGEKIKTKNLCEQRLLAYLRRGKLYMYVYFSLEGGNYGFRPIYKPLDQSKTSPDRKSKF